MGGWVFGWAFGRAGFGQEVFPGCISETVRCRKLVHGRDIGWGCRCAVSWCDLDLTFDLAAVTLSLKILSGPCPDHKELYLELYITYTALKVSRTLYCFTTSVSHGVENYFSRLCGTGISAIFLYF